MLCAQRGGVVVFSEELQEKLANVRARTDDKPGQRGMAVMDAVLEAGVLGDARWLAKVRPEKRFALKPEIVTALAEASGVDQREITSCWALYRHVLCGSRCREAEEVVRRGIMSSAHHALMRFDAKGRVAEGRSDARPVRPTEPVRKAPVVEGEVAKKIAEVTKGALALSPEEGLTNMLGTVHSVLLALEAQHRSAASESSDSKEFWHLVDRLKEQVRTAKREAAQMWLRQAR